MTVGLLTICLYLQSVRKDRLFVFTHIENPHLEIWIEYLAWTFPFAISSLFNKYWFFYLLLMAGLYVITYLNYSIRQKTWLGNISILIPATNFEWISGIRKNMVYTIPLYLVAIGFGWFSYLSLFILWLLTIIITTFYSECEPLQILKEGNNSPKLLLGKKMIKHGTCLIILYAPVLMLNTLVNPENWLVNFLFVVVQISLLCFSIGFKYTMYEPNKPSTGGEVIQGLTAIGSVIPFLVPVPVIMAFRYYYKAIRNLNNYLHD